MVKNRKQHVRVWGRWLSQETFPMHLFTHQFPSKSSLLLSLFSSASYSPLYHMILEGSKAFAEESRRRQRLQSYPSHENQVSTLIHCWPSLLLFSLLLFPFSFLLFSSPHISSLFSSSFISSLPTSFLLSFPSLLSSFSFSPLQGNDRRHEVLLGNR